MKLSTAAENATCSGKRVPPAQGAVNASQSTATKKGRTPSMMTSMKTSATIIGNVGPVATVSLDFAFPPSLEEQALALRIEIAERQQRLLALELTMEYLALGKAVNEDLERGIEILKAQLTAKVKKEKPLD